MIQYTDYFVSVIIPVYNDAERLKKCLLALEKQTYPQAQYEVIVVDNASEENIKDVVSQFPQARLTFENSPGSYAARNQGISIAKGEILAFTDADCIPTPNWIETGVKHLLSLSRPGIVAGGIKMFFKNPNNPTVIELYDSITNLQQKKMVEQAHCGATANLLTFKKVFEEVGLFDRELKSGGDSEWGKRAFSLGYPIEYAEESCVAHPARSSFTQLYKKVLRVRGGFYALEKKQTQENKNLFLSELIKVLWKWKPPLIYAVRKSFFNQKVKAKRVEIFIITLVFHYAGILEKTRLLFGGEAQR